MLTKKDFIQLAKDFVNDGFKINTDEKVLRFIINFCRGQNGAFDKDRFISYIETLQKGRDEKLRNLVTDGITK